MKIQSFSTKIKLDKNWLIYQFHTNLGSKHFGYFERYFQKHYLFEKIEIQNILSVLLYNTSKTQYAIAAAMKDQSFPW